jgi:hypothetical protein
VERLVGAVDWNQNDAQNWRKQCQAEADLRARYRAALERIKAVTLENTTRRIIEEALGDDG